MVLTEIMRKLKKIFGYIPMIKRKNNECGFVFLELAVGLPLIIMLLWTMNSMFANTWQKCKFAMADFVLQQEMELVMARMVEMAKIAYKVDIKNNGSSITFYYYEFTDFNGPQSNTYIYFQRGILLHRGVTSGLSNPITGLDMYSSTAVNKFYCRLLAPEHPNLLHITLDAKSLVSQHNFTLTTEVFMRGYQNLHNE